MPIFEVVILIQKLERAALKDALKRTAGYIFEQDGIIRNIENLGFRQLPYSLYTKGSRHKFANYFIFRYDTGFQKPKLILEKLKLDLDVVKATNFLQASNPMVLHLEKKKPECTLYEDLLPAPFRPTVMEIEKIGKSKAKKTVKKNDDSMNLLVY